MDGSDVAGKGERKSPSPGSGSGRFVFLGLFFAAIYLANWEAGEGRMGSFEPAQKKARSDVDLSSLSFQIHHQSPPQPSSIAQQQQTSPITQTVQQQQQQQCQQQNGDFECRRYTTPEGCPYGSKCRFKHGPFDDRDLTQQTSALGSKTKPCTKFFSTSGCPYGEGCHFLHYVPGGINSLQVQAANGTAALSSAAPGGAPGTAGSTAASPASTTPGGGVAAVTAAAAVVPDPSQTVNGYKTRLCNRYNTPEGCRFGEKCHFAHGEADLRPSNPRPSPATVIHLQNGATAGIGGAAALINGTTVFSSNPVATSVYYGEPTPPGVPAATTFGSISVTRMSIEAAYAGAIIGKAGANVKQISKVTGCKVSIRDHETDPNMRNVEMEGSLEQIESASEMVRQLLQTREVAPPRGPALGSHNFKTKLCENYSSGTCTFAERCHFAHGTQELRPIIR
ncbi:zinc finger CCCH domain-containing protein 14 [Selaginella moellendorffii]|uniref:zinc finger CCCH domain-containing protein 14 n=1 Tax=Selaginella moellendorffii TaxID=88036 RepID=UPI000D1C58C9|nr:zinc finger CCCH domain-containing protein 14 [Selaginella moellendorffii]|eukprot:XP_024527485.1 zinc finger CCCH domain-containing protein 14 [Selaginella moellendorffii]